MLPLLSRELAVVVDINGVEDRAHLVRVRVRVRARVRLRVRVGSGFGVRVRVGVGSAIGRELGIGWGGVREDRADRGLGVGRLLQVRLG